MNDPVLAQALAALESADVPVIDDAACTDLLGAIRKVRGWVDAVEARVTSRMGELHATAGAAPAADLHTRCGGVSSAEGKRKERRSGTIEQAPSFGDALADGAIGAEHVDALANARAQLDDEVRETLFGLEDELLDDATRMTPERFGRGDRVRRPHAHSHRPRRSATVREPARCAPRAGSAPSRAKGGGVMRASEPIPDGRFEPSRAPHHRLAAAGDPLR